MKELFFAFFSPLLLCLPLWLLPQLSMPQLLYTDLPQSMLQHLPMHQPQFMVLSLPTQTLSQPTTTTMECLTSTAELSWEPLRLVMDTTPMVNTMFPFPMVVFRLLPTLLMEMVMLLMSNTLESQSMLLLPLPQPMPQSQFMLLPQSTDQPQFIDQLPTVQLHTMDKQVTK